VESTEQKLPVPVSKLFVFPSIDTAVSALAGAGENTTGDLLDDTKAAAINTIKTPVLDFLKGLYNKIRGKTPTADTNNSPPLPFEVAAAVAIAIDTNDTRSEEHTSELQSRGHLVCR